MGSDFQLVQFGKAGSLYNFDALTQFRFGTIAECMKSILGQGILHAFCQPYSDVRLGTATPTP